MHYNPSFHFDLTERPGTESYALVHNCPSTSDYHRNVKSLYPGLPSVARPQSQTSAFLGTVRHEPKKVFSFFPDASMSIYSTAATGFKARPIFSGNRAGSVTTLDTCLKIYYGNATTSPSRRWSGTDLRLRDRRSYALSRDGKRGIRKELKDFLILIGMEEYGFGFRYRHIIAMGMQRPSANVTSPLETKTAKSY